MIFPQKYFKCIDMSDVFDNHDIVLDDLSIDSCDSGVTTDDQSSQVSNEDSVSTIDTIWLRSVIISDHNYFRTDESLDGFVKPMRSLKFDSDCVWREGDEGYDMDLDLEDMGTDFSEFVQTTITQCAQHDMILEDKVDHTAEFCENFPRLLRGYSFPLHDKICTCGTIDRCVHITKFKEGIARMVSAEPRRVEREDSRSDDVSEFNEKQYRRGAWRHRRRQVRPKRVKGKIRARPMAGEQVELPKDLDLISLAVKLFAAWKSKSFFIILIFIIDGIRDHVSPEHADWLRNWVDEWKLKMSTLTLEDVVLYAEKAVSNWKNFASGDLFKIVGELFTLVCILFMSPKEFIPSVKAKYVDFLAFIDSSRINSTDVISWAIKTFAAVSASLKKFAETGDIVQAFCAVTPFQEATTIFDNCLDYYNKLNLGLADRSLDYNVVFPENISKLELLASKMCVADNRRTLSFISRLKAWQSDVNIADHAKSARIQPFAITLTGATGSGKSGLTQSLMPFLLKANGFAHQDRNMATPRMESKFWDGVSNDTYGMIWDDPDFIKPEYTQEVAYVSKIGGVLNNAQYLYEMASLDNKGKTVCNVKVAILSSNSTEFGVNDIANEPGAILRRFMYHCDVKVRPEFCKVAPDGTTSTVLDASKVNARFGDDDFPDVFDISVYEVVVVDRGGVKRKMDLSDLLVTHQMDRYCFVYTEYCGKSMNKVGISTFLSFLRDKSQIWFDDQNKILERRRRSVCELCDECSLPKNKCNCHVLSKNSDGGSLSDCIIPPTVEDDDESSDDSDDGGVIPEDDEMPMVDKVPAKPKDNVFVAVTPQYRFGKVPGDLKPGPNPCVACKKGCSADSLWGFKDAKRKSAGICKPCLAFTRLTCKRCRKATDADVGMRRKSKRIIEVSDFCKNCYRPTAFNPMSSSEPLIDSFSRSVHDVIDHEMQVRRIEDNLNKCFRGVVEEYVNKGTVTGIQMFKQLDSFFLGECAYFLEELVDEALHYVSIKGLLTWQYWLPDDFVKPKKGALPIGAYLHSRSSSAKWIHYLDAGVTACAITGGAIISVFNPIVGSAVLLLTAGLLCATEGHLVSKPLFAMAESMPEEVGKFATLWRSANTKKGRKKARYIALDVLVGFLLHIPLMFTWKFFPLILTFYAVYMYFYSKRNRAFVIGTRLNSLYEKLREPSPFDEMRNNVLPTLYMGAGLVRVLTLVGDVVCSVRLNFGIRPMGNDMSIVDYASLSSMSKYWYKKAWHDVNIDPLPVSKKCSPVEAINRCTKNLLRVFNEDKKTGCCAVALGSKLILIPGHIISDDYAKYTFLRKEDTLGVCGNARFTVKFRKKDAKRVAPDLYLVEHPTFGDFLSLSSLFLDKLDRIPTTGVVVVREVTGTITTSNVDAIARQLVSNAAPDLGSVAKWDGISFQSDAVRDGFCMGLIISIENPSAILGFALGGTSTKLGVATLHTKDDVTRFAQVFNDNPSVIATPHSGTFPQQMYNVNCVIQGVHANSIAAHLGTGHFMLLGSTGSIERDDHDIVATPLADGVCDLMTNKKWGPPPLEGNYSLRGRKEKWLHTIEEYISPKEFVPRELLDECVEDYKRGIQQLILDEPPTLKRCLTDAEVVQGIDGCEFIGPMEASTSVGFPIGGPKKKFMKSVDDGLQRRNEFTTDQFRLQSLKLEDGYLRGERAYPVSKAFPKIEPTDVTKERCRLVYGAPLHFQWTVRKKLGAIIKYICEHPRFFECSVGVCPYGGDWNAMYWHLREKALRKCIALDYKMFDGTTTSQFIGAVFSILRSIAAIFGWSAADLTIIEGIAADIMWPVVCYNGDLLMLYNGTVSGHNLTSILNSMVNSLNLRVVFYTLHPGGVVRTWTFATRTYTFRELIVAYFYGDDMIVTSAIDSFNNLSIERILSGYGRVLTSYDKKSTLKKYDNIDEVEYLKRSFKYDRTLKRIVGPLNEDSICKRLASVHKPTTPNTMYTLMHDNVDSACTEWFYYGDRVYNERRRVLIDIVNSTKDDVLIAACRSALRMSYKDRLRVWESLYL
jgi:hypothetical protein